MYNIIENYYNTCNTSNNSNISVIKTSNIILTSNIIITSNIYSHIPRRNNQIDINNPYYIRTNSDIIGLNNQYTNNGINTLSSTSWFIGGWFWFWFIFIIIWALLGFFAYIMAIVCIGNRGTNGEKMLGLLLAIFLGPFYWLYYGFSSTYCTTVRYAGGSKKK